METFLLRTQNIYYQQFLKKPRDSQGDATYQMSRPCDFRQEEKIIIKNRSYPEFTVGLKVRIFEVLLCYIL